MTQAKTEWEKVVDEQDKCGQLMAVWAILKNGDFVGRVTARTSRTRASTTVTFHMFGAKGVRGYRRMTGWGYDRTGTAIVDILQENEEVLKEVHGMEFPRLKEHVLFNWGLDMENSGYTVVRAI